jgi:radical SAM superfamily enzyme
MSGRIRVVPIFIPMMGCTHQCVFCNQNAVTGISGSHLLANIKEQLDRGMSCLIPADYNEIAFFGGSFTCLNKAIQEEFLDMARPFMDLGKIQGIRFSTRPDYIDRQHLLWLKGKGVVTIELGIQSTDEGVLRASGRGHGASDIFVSSRMIRESGLKLGLQMMIGLPGDTSHKSMKTAIDITGLRPDFVRIYPTLVLEGSPLAKLYEEGSYQPLGLVEAVEQVARLKILFEAHNIPVIRTGLQANEGLDSGQAYIAGPYHPAFGEMTDSRIYLFWMEDAIQSVIGDTLKSVTFYLKPTELSKALGQKRSVLNSLLGKYPGLSISILGDKELDRHQMRIELRGGETSCGGCKGSSLGRDHAVKGIINKNGALGTTRVLFINRHDFIEKAARLLMTQYMNEVLTFAALR